MIDLISSSASSIDAPPPILDARELLTEFATTGRQEPFEEVVRRYGGMVYNLCYEVTGNRHDAEDAVQAAFLSLAVQVRSGQQIQAIGPWLQQVARRLSLDLNRSRKRRKKREDRHSEAWEARKIDAGLGGNGNGQTLPEAAAGWEELRHIMQEELNELPPKYRMPLIMHYYGGLSREEMARELGCRANTLGVRLHRGREMLGKRLAKRGVALSSLIFGVLMSEVVHSVVSDRLVACTAQAAVLYSAGHPYACGLVSSDVVVMAKNAGRALGLAKVKFAAMFTVLAGGAAAAGAQMLSAVGYQVPKPATRQFDQLFQNWFKAPSAPLGPRVDNGEQPMNDHLARDNVASPQPIAPGGNWTVPAPGGVVPPQYTVENRWPGIWTPTLPPGHTGSVATKPNPGSPANAPTDRYSAPLPGRSQELTNSANGGFRAPGSSGGGGGSGNDSAGGGKTRDHGKPNRAIEKGEPQDRQIVDRKPPARPGPSKDESHQDPGRGGVKPEPRPQEHVQDGSPKPPGVRPDPIVQDPSPSTPPKIEIKPPLPDVPLPGPFPRPVPQPPRDANNGEDPIPGPNPPDLNSGPGGFESNGAWYITGEFRADGTTDSFESVIAGGRGRAMFQLDAGTLTNREVVVGHAGTGAARQTGGTHTVDSLYLGAVKTGRGQYELTGGTLAVTRGGAAPSDGAEPAAPPHVIEIGTAGEGRFLLGNATSTGEVREVGEGGAAVGMTVGVTRTAQASLRGWGTVALTGELVNNGQVVADGYGQSRTLDLSSFAGVRHDFVNRAGDARGWYAKNGGKLDLPAVPVAAGTNTYTWGNNADDRLSMVNSVRVTLSDAVNDGALDISLLALDRADLPAFAGGHTLIGIWSFDTGGLDIAGGVDLLVRYDDALAAELGLDENVLKLWTYDGGEWHRLDFDPTFVRDPLQHTLAAHTDAGDLTYFAVSAPEPGAIGLLAIAAATTLTRRRKRASLAD